MGINYLFIFPEAVIMCSIRLCALSNRVHEKTDSEFCQWLTEHATEVRKAMAEKQLYIKPHKQLYIKHISKGTIMSSRHYTTVRSTLGIFFLPSQSSLTSNPLIYITGNTTDPERPQQ